MSLFKLLLSCLFYCITTCLYAQNDSIKPVQIIFKVIDAKTKKPIEYATVIVTGNTYKKSKYTHSNGLCAFDSLPTGTYSACITFTGYIKKIIQNVTPTQSQTFQIELNNDPHNTGCNFSNPLINKTEPTHDNFNSRKIMRMPY